MIYGGNALTSDGAGDFSSVIKNLQDVNKVYLKRLKEFISSNEIQDYCKKKSEILKVYHLDETEQFSFFESISDKYYYEKFHSDILRTILSPDTPKIGNKAFLKAFLSCIDVGEDDFDVERNTEVVTEQYTQGIESKGYIDIIIRNSKGKAIIIIIYFLSFFHYIMAWILIQFDFNNISKSILIIYLNFKYYIQK